MAKILLIGTQMISLNCKKICHRIFEFGQYCKFKLKHKQNGKIVDYELESDSLLIMSSECQDDYLRAVSKTAITAIEDKERIN